VSDRSTLRLIVLGVLFASLLATLLARLFFLQVIEGPEYRAAAVKNTVRELVNAAPRGLILDQAGRPMVANRTSIVITVDRAALARESDRGDAAIQRLSKALNIPEDRLRDKLKNCGTEGAKPPPVCWNGSPYQPVPIARDIDPKTAMAVVEDKRKYPGIDAQLEAIRTYPAPFDVNAAHVLGYLGPVTEEQIATQENTPDRLRRTDVVGRTGLEAQYDSVLRGKPAVTQLAVDTAGRVTGTIDEIPATPGTYLVSTIDAHLQAVVEKELLAAISRAQELGNKGDSGAAVVVDVRNGNILAMASYPTYDPGIWVGGVSKKEFTQLQREKALSSNAVQGVFAPGSTFKVISTAAAARERFNLSGTYACPSSLQLGDRTFRNFESNAYGRISLARALEVSCNTVFYGIAEKMWRDSGGDKAVNQRSAISDVSRSFGLGSKTGIDIPGESAGRVASPEFKRANWEQNRDRWCNSAKVGYPETRKTNPKLADYFTALDAENCADGFRWRAGDALNASIGQGDTVVTPLQMAMVYAAIANGGTLYQPKLVKGTLSPDGSNVSEIPAVVKGKLDVPKASLNFLRRALPGVTTDGSGKIPFIGFPLNRIPVASKTGSAQVVGAQVSTSWFASYAPANDPKYAIVMMVTQGGTGSGTSGPSVRRIYEKLFGVRGGSVNPEDSVLIGASPQRELPKVGPDGMPIMPKGKKSGFGSEGVPLE
jgi:penicillin-binding protein 2